MTARLPREMALLLAGSAVFAGWSAARLPAPAAIVHLPSTPYDRDRSAAAEFHFFTESAARIPRGMSVVARSEPRDPVRETRLHTAAVALLPGRRVLPAALWGLPTPEWEAQARYVLVYGPLPAEPPGDPVATLPGGSLYRRPSR
ncbi:MAG: hypothetical protein ABI592_10310 [Acidobacteriota bacterium]